MDKVLMRYDEPLVKARILYGDQANNFLLYTDEECTKELSYEEAKNYMYDPFVMIKTPNQDSAAVFRVIATGDRGEYGGMIQFTTISSVGASSAGTVATYSWNSANIVVDADPATASEE